MKHTVYLFFTMFLLSFSFSCSTKVSVEITHESTETISCDIKTGKILEQTLQSITGLHNTESLYDKPMLQQSLEKSGFTIQKMIFTGMGGINLSIGTPTLVFPGCTITKDSFTLLINPFIMAEIVSLMPEDTIAYTELLMAPLISGEKISAEEYKMLIASMYGETLADELEKSTVTILFKSPKNIATATTEPSICKSIKITKNEVEYSLSTLDFLSLFSGIKFRIQWKL